MVSGDAVLTLKKQIKSWEYNFQQKEKRQPTKADIKADSVVYKLYKVYRAVKSKSQLGPPQEVVEKPVVIEKEKEDFGPCIEINIADPFSEGESDDEHKSDSKAAIPNMELGPTPQANGKVLSILDFRLTPPDSSPLKSKVNVKRESQGTEDIFKTPTKRIKKIEMMDSGHKAQSNSNMAMKLQLASKERYPSPIKSKIDNSIENIALETPRYLSRNTRKFDFSSFTSGAGDMSNREQEEITSSPLGNDIDMGPVTPTKSKKVPLTPTKTNSMNFSVSPSPLKTQRFLSRKLSEIFYDNKEIPEEEPAGEGDSLLENVDLSPPEETRNSIVPKKSKTQKRTTRRWKIKPKLSDDVDDKFEGKNIHDEIKKIDEDNYQELKKYMGTDDESDEESEEETLPTKTKVSSVGKIKPISMNYQRLKINDPRSKAFKRRMKNRR